MGWLGTTIRKLQDPKDKQTTFAVCALLLVGEAVLSTAIVWKVPYTEIDWTAYMEQLELIEQGELDYFNIKGGTGPLVYPAGHVAVYKALRWATNGGSIPLAQWYFVGIYLATQAVVMLLYAKAALLPPWALALLCLSKRIHSIYMLRLFNDGIASLLAYIATYLLLSGKYRSAILMYSAGVSVKMNVLLMAPPVLAVVLQGSTVQDVLAGGLAGILLQAVLAIPFLLAAPWSYFSRAFEFSRVFFHVWTVNLKFLPGHIFQSKQLAMLLLGLHLFFLGVFGVTKWFPSFSAAFGALGGFFEQSGFGQKSAKGSSKSSGNRRMGDREKVQLVSGFALNPQYVLYTVFTGNFIGICFARTLHFQFYSWYFHTIPLLLWSTGLPTVLRLCIWGAIEVVWNVFPSQPWSSLTLCAAHAVLLLSLLFSPAPAAAQSGQKSKVR